MDVRLPATARNMADPEDILGQFFFAFGQGAGTMRVQRNAIAALRGRYGAAIRESSDQWETAAPHVLSLVAQVGRLASALATHAGRAAISEADFVAARQAVEARVHGQAEQKGRLIAGPFCPAVAGEAPLSLPDSGARVQFEPHAESSPEPNRCVREATH